MVRLRALTPLGLAVAVMASAPLPARTLAPSSPVSVPEARPEDVASLDAILAALYDVISGPAGQRRDWDRMRSLFVEGARLVPAVYPRDSTPSLRIWSVDQYITTVGPRLESNGFFEREIARRSERYGGVVHVFSTYESRRAANDPAPFARGINSIQVFYDGKRWWILSIFWESERPDNPIPPRYLTTPGN